ncbi:MAG: DUF1287 domain-containing protein [Candidatus Gracilibacteria bacterium]|jgi:hypothetical protein
MKNKLLIVMMLVVSALGSFWLVVPDNERLEIDEKITSSVDKDSDGLDDYTDIMEGARAQIGVVTEYDTGYYQDAYPPENSGVCADVIWRALEEAGYDLKEMLDADMALYPEDYTQDPAPDTNINFRRVRNIKVFLEKYAESLTIEVIPWDEENLAEWQGGDIVSFDQIEGGLWHIAIVSDERRDDGVPLIIHNYGYGVKENDYLLNWPTEITGHYRWVVDR